MEIDRNIDAQLPRPGLYGERRNKSPINPNVQKRLEQYLVKMRNLQDVYYDETRDPTGNDKRAFELALRVATRWLNNERLVDLNIDGQTVTADLRRNANTFNGVKTLVWAEDHTGTKFYYTIDVLKDISLT